MFESASISGRATGIATAISIFVFALVLTAPVAIGCGVTGCSTGTYSGRAYGAWIHTPLAGDTTVADTGDLPPEGGVIDATFDHLDTPVATASLFFSLTTGVNGLAASAASTSYVTLIPGDVPLVTTTFAFAWTSATCGGVMGAAEVANLYVQGNPVLVTNDANQIVYVPGVFTLIINEVIVSQDATCNSITVNALHLWTAGGVEIVVSHAHSDITCGVPAGGGGGTEVPHDFITGGGFIYLTGEKMDNNHGNFGFVAGYKPGKDTLSGNFNYIDHLSKMHVKADSVDTYTVGKGPGDGPARTFTGMATVDGSSGHHYEVTAQDNAEPGRGVDWFSLSIPDLNYFVSGYLGGGNIQLHTHP